MSVFQPDNQSWPRAASNLPAPLGSAAHDLAMTWFGKYCAPRTPGVVCALCLS